MNNAEEAVHQPAVDTGSDTENSTKKRRRRRRNKRNDRQGADGTQTTALDSDDFDGDSDGDDNDVNAPAPTIQNDSRNETNTPNSAPSGSLPERRNSKDRNKRRRDRNAQPSEQGERTTNGQQPLDEQRSERDQPDRIAPVRAQNERSPSDRPTPERQQNSRNQDKNAVRSDKPREARPPRGNVLERRAERLGNSASRMADETETVVQVFQPPVNVQSVDSYVSHLRGWQKEVVSALRAIIKNSTSEFEETIAWSQPVYNLNGPVCYIKAFSEHINFGFWRGVELDDPDGLLLGDMTYMRHITIRGAQDVRRDRFENFVRQAARLNKEKGDPTSM